jgi:hypothetical protein
MSQPDSTPNYITQTCQHCGGHIKFDANQLRQGETKIVECPHCHLETVVFHPHKEGEDSTPLKISKSSKIELFLFELTRFPTIVVAISVLVALLIIAYLSMQAFRPLPPEKPPVISYESVALQKETFQNGVNTFVPNGGKIANKNEFPQPVVDFLIKHIGFSLKEWLDQLKPEHRHPFLDNLAQILQTANKNNLNDEQIKQVVINFAESWIATVKNDEALQEKSAEEKHLRFLSLLTTGFSLLITLMILCLILVLLAIERNTRSVEGKKL